MLCCCMDRGRAQGPMVPGADAKHTHTHTPTEREREREKEKQRQPNHAPDAGAFLWSIAVLEYYYCYYVTLDRGCRNALHWVVSRQRIILFPILFLALGLALALGALASPSVLFFVCLVLSVQCNPQFPLSSILFFFSLTCRSTPSGWSRQEEEME